MNKNDKLLIGFLFVIIFIILGFILIKNIFKDDNNYGYNQVTYKKITEQDIAELYYSDFMNTIDIDIEEAYKLLGKNKMNYNEFLIFVDELYVEGDDILDDESRIKSYKVKENNGYKLFYIKDYNDRTYVFKENSIMNYTVYLDEKDI